MTNKKVAIFVDWENVRKSIFEEAYHKHHLKADYNDIPTVKKFISSFLLPDEEIYRIFFYLSEPFSGTINGVDYSKTPNFSMSMSFIERLSITDNIAVRKGYLAARGGTFIQKQVDMLLGLDIAHVSYNKLADRILILSADTDIVPAMKTARINGLQVIFGYCGDIQIDIHRKLKEHSDFTRSINFKTIFPGISPSKP